MAERNQEINPSGLTRIVHIGEDGQLNFSRECVEEQNLGEEFYGPFTLPANPALRSFTPDWLPIFHNEKPTKEDKQ